MAALTEEQALIKDQAKSWALEQAPVQKFRQMRDHGIEQCFDSNVWTAVVEMGWTGIIIPEQYGGSNFGYLAFGLVIEELGQQLTASPLFASALVGATALLMGGSEDQKQAFLPRIVDGSEIFTLALEETSRHDPTQIGLRATRVGSGYALSGRKTFVLEGIAATTFIVPARTSGTKGDRGGITLFLIPADSTGLTRSAISLVDSRGYAQLDFESVAAGQTAILGDVDEGFSLLESTLDRARSGLGSEMLGIGTKAFDMTLEYLKTREQFGRLIGSFQALGHRAAVLFTRMELARSCVEAALQAIDSGDADIPVLSSLSKCRAGDFLHSMSNQLIQIHGGIGMTDEFDAGFYLKRARALETTFGNQAYHRDRYAKLLGY